MGEKLCPLRKKRISVDIERRAMIEDRLGEKDESPVLEWEEEFLPCLEGKCAWWDKESKICAVFGIYAELWSSNNFKGNSCL